MMNMQLMTKDCPESRTEYKIATFLVRYFAFCLHYK